MNKCWLALTAVGPVLLLNGCDECKEYSNYTCNQIKNATYNVMFTFPLDKMPGRTSARYTISAWRRVSTNVARLLTVTLSQKSWSGIPDGDMCAV